MADIDRNEVFDLYSDVTVLRQQVKSGHTDGVEAIQEIESRLERILNDAKESDRW